MGSGWFVAWGTSKKSAGDQIARFYSLKTFCMAASSVCAHNWKRVQEGKQYAFFLFSYFCSIFNLLD